MVELRLLPVPENAQGKKAHEIHQQLWAEVEQPVPQLMFGVNCLQSWQTQIEHQQSHGDGEYSIAQSRQPFPVLIGDLVIKRAHAESVLSRCPLILHYNGLGTATGAPALCKSGVGSNSSAQM